MTIEFGNWGKRRGVRRLTDVVMSRADYDELANSGTNPPYDSVELHTPFETTLSDVSNAARTVTNNNGVTLSASKFKFGTQSALFVRGSTQYLSVADAAALRPGTGDFQVRMWVNFNSTVAHGLAGKSTGGNSWWIAISATDVGFQCGGTTITVIPSPANDQWYFINCYRINGLMVAERDGYVVATAANTADINNTGDVFIGAGGGVALDGHIQDFQYAVGDVGIDIPTGFLPRS